jgi:peptide/nickel transport system permease protein
MKHLFDRLFGVDSWYRFRRNSLGIIGLVIVGAILVAAALAPWIAPYPHNAEAFIDFANSNQGPSATYFMGSDLMGRDLLSRIIFGYRISLAMSVMVVALAAAIGVSLGLVAGYFGGVIDMAIMRVTDVFLAVPPLVLAMAVMGLMEPTLVNAMLAVTIMWWPWYTRLTYNLARSVSQEGYVQSAEIIGSSRVHILFREILPNCLPTILTKMTLDLGFVVLIASSLSFLGLGVQPPTPDLGSMVAEGAQYLPDSWWLVTFPALAILLVVLGFNFIGDALRDAIDQSR